MHHGKVVAVVIPAFDEARLVGRVIRGLPSWVDHVVVVDDASRDDTSGAASRTGDPRLTVLRHPENRGVGAAIATGYAHALALGADVLAVMAGDDQMDPGDLARLVEPVALGAADYVKGNRFVHGSRDRMPAGRRVAGAALSAFTRLTTGLTVDDTQCGYTALSSRAARALPIGRLWPRYGYPNDLLGMLAARSLRVREVPVRPVYADEASGVRPWHALVVAFVIGRRWLRKRSRAR